jgi:hypothetical protein
MGILPMSEFLHCSTTSFAGRAMTIRSNMVQLGISALEAGDRSAARAHFRAAILHNPRNEEAWLGMAAVVADQKERHYCFERVLALNPANLTAQHGLAMLNADADAPTIALISEGALWASSAQTVAVGAQALLSASAPTVSMLASSDMFSSAQVASLPPPAAAMLEAEDASTGGTIPFFALPPLQAPVITQESAVDMPRRSITPMLALATLSLFCLLLITAVLWLI